MLAHNLESGEWSVRGNEVSVKVAMSQVMVDVALGDGPKRIVHDALAKASGKPMKFQNGERRSAIRAQSCAAFACAHQTAQALAAGPCPILLCSACRKSSERKFVPSSTRRTRLGFERARYAANCFDEPASAGSIWYRSIMGGFNLQEMLAQARQQAEKLQEKMQQIVVEASSGGGSVTVKMNGQKHLLSVVIEPDVVKSGDIEMLQDLVTAAVNAASQKVDDAMKSSLGGMLGGLGLPGM